MHNALWMAITNLAHEKHMSCSHLAKISGLDPTTFNKSKRFSKYGQPRWVSMETVAKVLSSTGTSFTEFAQMIDNCIRTENEKTL